MMTVLENLNDWQKLKFSPNFHGRTLGFVPTMGALHQGHVSLIERSKKEMDRTLVSIFVNPTQFDDPQDFSKYPKTLAEDLKILEKAGVDYVLLPQEKDIYPDQYAYQVSENDLSSRLCGAHRPGHFKGMLTIVMKLLNLADAQRAYFGEKDYQQYLLIKGMAEAFFLKTQIIPCPTVRETDGLAMSSRNQRLKSEERKKAAKFPQTLMDSTDPLKTLDILNKEGFEVDYIEELGGRRFGAVRLGDVRLIDNVRI
jgi:pantoate--beta-alanine ligase